MGGGALSSEARLSQVLSVPGNSLTAGLEAPMKMPEMENWHSWNSDVSLHPPLTAWCIGMPFPTSLWQAGCTKRETTQLTQWLANWCSPRAAATCSTKG